uniref:Mitochondrial fission 1 protein n=1 Tax=Astyanax mexicanus TaxID=7994 RepID=A0A8B9JDM8_ASTMX
MEAVVEEIVAPEDLEKFGRKYKAELEKGSVSKNTKFEYAWCLIRSKSSTDIKTGIELLDDLIHKGTKDDQRDYLFYLAVGNYKLKVKMQTLYPSPATNTLITYGLVGMAIVGGIGLGVAGLAGLIGLAVAKKAG